MTATVITDVAQGSDTWLEARRAGITGTDIGAILGVNPWKTQLDVWLEKKPDHTPDPVGEAAHWGSALEPLVRSHYARQHPGSVVEEVPGILCHPDDRRLIGSLDGLAHDKNATRILEIKTTRQRWAEDYLPDHYLTQVLWYMGICDLGESHVAVLTAGSAYSERVVAASPLWFDGAANVALDWWDRHVIGGVMPEVDAVRDAPLLPRLWTPVPGAQAWVDDDLVTALRDARAAYGAAKTDYDEACARVQIAMSEATEAVDSTGEVVARWTGTKARVSPDVERMRADGIYDEYSKQGQPGRRFSVTNERGG